MFRKFFKVGDNVKVFICDTVNSACSFALTGELAHYTTKSNGSVDQLVIKGSHSGEYILIKEFQYVQKIDKN